MRGAPAAGAGVELGRTGRGYILRGKNLHINSLLLHRTFSHTFAGLKYIKFTGLFSSGSTGVRGLVWSKFKFSSIPWSAKSLFASVIWELVHSCYNPLFL